MLDAGRQCDLFMRVALVHAVGDSPVVEQRREHVLHRGDDVVEAADIQKGFLLTGERGVGKVFRGGG